VSAPDGEQAPLPGSVAPQTIKVGIAYVKDPGAANAAAGFGGIGQIDQKRASDLMIREINKANIYGRKLVPVYYAYTTDDVTSKGAERIYQEICAKFTQDDKVFMTFVTAEDSLQACLTKAKVVQLGGLGGFSTRSTYQKYPYLVSPTEATLDRMAEFEVDQLFKQRFFSTFKDNEVPYSPTKPADGKARIGLIRYDQPAHAAAATAMKKRLQSHGLSLCGGCEFQISYSSDNLQEQLDDATEVNAAIQNCKNRPDGPCTHMLFLGSSAGGRISIFFVDGAEKQQYRPMLGFNPHDLATLTRDFLGPSSHPQFRQSQLVTWDPAELKIETDGFKKCRAMFEDAGEDFSGEEGSNKLAQIKGYCDDIDYVKAVWRAGGAVPLTLASWLKGVSTMKAIPSAGTYRMQTTSARHDGVGAIQVGGWADSCNCFKPKTGVIGV
jgi:hypothetical protein